jgi:hypothetical protein
MILAQAITGLAFFFIAADFAAVDGAVASRLRLPLASLAERCFWLIPVIALLPCVLPRRIPAWLRVVVCDAVVLCLVLLPLAVVTIGTRSLPVSEVPPMSSPVLYVEPNVPVVFISDRDGWRAIYPRSRDERVVRSALHRRGIEVRP